MNDWQPIKTAPKDGTPILLWWKGCTKPAVGKWEIDETYEDRKRPAVPEGWRCDGDACIPTNQLNCTHWMPLPEPPSNRYQEGYVNGSRKTRDEMQAEVGRLRAAIQDIADMQDDEWNEVKYHAMRDWAKRALR
jgi:Protein of unknown function (DUF551)